MSLGFHGANNLKFDCWPLDATKTQNHVVDCDGNINFVVKPVHVRCINTNLGLEMQWTEPPRTVEEGQKFNVSYWVTAEEQFFESSTNAYPGKK